LPLRFYPYLSWAKNSRTEQFFLLDAAILFCFSQFLPAKTYLNIFTIFISPELNLYRYQYSLRHQHQHHRCPLFLKNLLSPGYLMGKQDGRL
jgi:hypothetical protein